MRSSPTARRLRDGWLKHFLKNLRDGGQEAHVLGEASLVLEGGGVVEFVYVRGHTSPFHFLGKQTFLEDNSQYDCANGVPAKKQDVYSRPKFSRGFAINNP